MAFAPVDQQNVRKCIGLVMQPFKASRNDFMDAPKIINTAYLFNLEPTIARLERDSVNELYKAGNRFAATQVRDVDAFDRSRCLRQL